MKIISLWIGMLFVVCSGCSGSSSSSVHGASGVDPAQMAGTFYFVPSLGGLPPNTNRITLNADQTAQVSWEEPNQNDPQQPFTYCYAGTWTVDSQGAVTITASTNCGAGQSGTVEVNFQVSRDLNLFIFILTFTTPNKGPGSFSIDGTAIRQ